MVAVAAVVAAAVAAVTTAVAVVVVATTAAVAAANPVFRKKRSFGSVFFCPNSLSHDNGWHAPRFVRFHRP